MVLCFPGLTDIIIQVNGMLHWLVAMRILSDQTGDIKLELNTEYRAKLAGFVHWAAFIDAGNVWLQRDDVNKPGGKFSKNFLNELSNRSIIA